MNEPDVSEIAKEFAESFPVHIAKRLGVSDHDDVPISTISTATAVVTGSLTFAAFMLITRAKGVEEAHRWFVELLTDLAAQLEVGLPALGVDAKIDVSGISMRRDGPGDDESGSWR